LNVIQPSDREAATLAPQKWIVCEQSGRWAAAMRVACSRQSNVQPMPRLYEVRTLGELATHLDEHGSGLTLIEVGTENLREVLQLLVRRRWQFCQFVALLENVAHQSQPIADLLWEVGVLEVVESPRQLVGLLALQNRLATVRRPIGGGVDERQSFADWAWSTLPWQDS
jgi:hypothetical protein